MGLAIEQAKMAAREGEVPVGCVIVRDSEVIATGRNRREAERSALGHAEIDAVAAACKALGDWRLSDAVIYVTLEPCPMCAGAIINARIPEVVFGARDPEAGAVGSVINLFEERFPHHPRVVGGVLEKECGALLDEFFQQVRRRQ